MAADEHLVISYGDTTRGVTLKAGQKIDSIVSTLNDFFIQNKIAVQATNKDGKLQISSTAYGSEEKISVYSEKDAAATGQLGIGTTALAGVGVNVVGTVNGVTGAGTGQTLKISTSDAKGLELLITAKTPMSSTLNLTHGIALNISQQLDAVSQGTTGFLRRPGSELLKTAHRLRQAHFGSDRSPRCRTSDNAEKIQTPWRANCPRCRARATSS